jgi:hypothetical protein
MDDNRPASAVTLSLPPPRIHGASGAWRSPSQAP